MGSPRQDYRLVDVGTIALFSIVTTKDELREQIEENTGDRFVQIEPIDSHDGFRMMQDFVETMRPSRLREKLEWSEAFSTLQGYNVREQARARTVAQVS